ncbi:hypothetical protein ACVWZ4_002498 [Bradyrhizobium sp. USDA 4472]
MFLQKRCEGFRKAAHVRIPYAFAFRNPYQALSKC